MHTIVLDPQKKASAATARYDGGFEEITVGTFSDTEVSEHTLVLNNGALFMTRDARARPVPAGTKLDP